jgi:hypothetical protein
MLIVFSQRLLSLLQLTRAALVFTAVSNSLTTLLLLYKSKLPPDEPLLPYLDWRLFLSTAFVAFGLYGFGMSLNDIIDRRRDQQVAAHRPLPSGRIHIVTAHIICILLALIAIVAGAIYWRIGGSWETMTLLAVTGLLISFYDFAGKWLVGWGLLTLGLIRACHALIPAGGVVVLWHPLLMLNHVAILSAVAYAWEQKRPALTKVHWQTVFGTLAVTDLLAVLISWYEDRHHGSHFLWAFDGFALPLGMAALFVGVGWLIRWRSSSSRVAGQRLMLVGLLWLIVYDAAFATSYIGLECGAAVLLLLPVSYLLVQMMRWWASIILLSQPPAYKRAGD